MREYGAISSKYLLNFFKFKISYILIFLAPFFTHLPIYPFTHLYGTSWAETYTIQNMLSRSPNDIVPPTLFGMHILEGDTTTPWPVVPFSAWRLWDAGVTWPRLEPIKGKWNFERLDADVNLAKTHNAEIILTLGSTPTWASARPTEPCSFSSIPGCAAEPANIEDWKLYVQTVATRYKGQIHYYEIYNEPNLGEFYTGTVDQLVTLAKEAYNILKTVDPQIKVISPSVTGSYGISYLQQYFAKGGGGYADIIGYHFYVSPGPPEDMISIINAVRQTMTNYNLGDKPLWNTEMGWFIENHFTTVIGTGSFSKVLNDTEAAAYVARSFILNWANGLDRLFWYAWDNAQMGLTEADGKTTKAPADAYKQLYYWLVGAKVTSCGQNSQGTWIAQLTRDGGYIGWIIWNPDKSINFDIPNEWNIKRMRNLDGQKTNTAGINQVSIGMVPILLENNGPWPPRNLTIK